MHLLNFAAAVVLAVFSFSAFAAMDQDEVLQQVAGQYRIKQGEQSLLFIIRSNGTVQVPEDDYYSFAEGSLSFSYSVSDQQHDGLPVAHIVIGVGSDENKSDYHILLSVRQDEMDTYTVEMPAKFTTFNDGPNGISELNLESFSVLRYNMDSRRFEELH